MTERGEIIQGYVNDMLAVEREAHAALSRQKHDATVKHYAEASRVIDSIEETRVRAARVLAAAHRPPA